MCAYICTLAQTQKLPVDAYVIPYIECTCAKALYIYIYIIYSFIYFHCFTYVVQIAIATTLHWVLSKYHLSTSILSSFNPKYINVSNFILHTYYYFIYTIEKNNSKSVGMAQNTCFCIEQACLSKLLG